MSQTILRLTVTSDFQVILDELRAYFPLLKDPDLIKLAVSTFYTEVKNNTSTTAFKSASKLSRSQIVALNRNAVNEGSKIGKQFLSKKGLDQANLSSDEIYELIKQA
jgi:hypothetical protein